MPTESQILKLDAISESLNSGAMLKAKLILNGLHPAEIARLLESSPPRQRRLIWEMLDHSYDGEVLLEVGEEVRNNLMESMDEQSLLAATKGLDVDDLADLLDENFGPTSESMEVKLFSKDEILWNELAFPTVERTLKYYIKDSKNNDFIFREEDITLWK